MNQFCIPNRRKALKKASSCLIGKFTIKKSKSISEPFLENYTFFCFLNHLESSHFSYQRSVDDKPQMQSNNAQRTKNSISRSRSFFEFDSEFS